ncbi:hypothetical protein L1987_70050 [Smallanthus sonchifolius]|uniref:Uncharacterized protein n=1 Tax=Smallanthus sonchifolius TaxID=185202 RepID=A0ACB9AMW8_9ASTR|nr:hypothetical protein L1987_70050 [Smallanthus sonchifolius]
MGTITWTSHFSGREVLIQTWVRTWVGSAAGWKETGWREIKWRENIWKPSKSGIWNWEKTPHLTTLLLPDDQELHFFPDEVEGKHATRLEDEGLALVPPSLPTNTNSFNTPQDEHPQKKHHVGAENTSHLVGKSISKGKERSETVKQQLIASVTSQTMESTVTDAPMTKVETQDFGYEKLKWQPKDCKMDDFTGVKFLKRMRDKTLAFVGDSLGRQQFQSLMCMVTGGEEMPDVEDVGKEYRLVKAHGSARPDGWAYRFLATNTTIVYYWSASLCDIEPVDSTSESTDYAMHLDRPPAFLKHFLDRIDVLVLNTGHHWNRGKLNANRWVMYVGGKPNTNRRIADIGGAKNFTIHSVVRWVKSELPKHPGGTCDSTMPGSLEVVQDESSDPIAAGAVKGTEVKLLDITGLSLVREEGHISRDSIRAAPGMQDCLHWCLPGVPDTWNELLFAQI